MQADVVDIDTLRTGRQRTGTYYAIWGMATKLALALTNSPNGVVGGISVEARWPIWHVTIWTSPSGR